MSEQKKQVNQGEFDKQVEIEFEWLVRHEYMKKDEAWKKAKETVSQTHEIVSARR